MKTKEIKNWVWSKLQQRTAALGTFVDLEANIYLDPESWHELRGATRMGEDVELSVTYDHRADRLTLFGQPVFIVLFRGDCDYIDISWKHD